MSDEKLDNDSVFDSHLNPLVAITTVQLLNPMRGSRSVGFLIESLGKGLWLVATCKHPFRVQGQDRYIFAMANPEPTMLKKVGQILDDPKEESDIAFLVLRDDTSTKKQPFVLTPENPQIKKDQVLYNAKNECNHITRLFSLLISRHPNVEKANKVGLCKVSDETETLLVDEGNTEEQERLLSLGYLKHNILWMQSRPGNSGSPIWDDDLQLHGINMRGSTAEPPYADFVVYISVSEIHKARQRIIPQLNKILGSL